MKRLIKWSAKRLSPPSANISIRFRSPTKYNIRIMGGFQSRNEATSILIIQAIQAEKGRMSHPFDLDVYTTDQPPKTNWRVAAYCRRSDQTNVLLVPDFIFWNWPEVGIVDYSSVSSSMIEAGRLPPIHSDLFWIGNPNTNPVRRTLLELSKGDGRITAIEAGYSSKSRPGKGTSGRGGEPEKSNFVTPAGPLHAQISDRR